VLAALTASHPADVDHARWSGFNPLWLKRRWTPTQWTLLCMGNCWMMLCCYNLA